MTPEIGRETAELIDRAREAIRDVPDFPRPGITFKDITHVLGDAQLFRELIAHFAKVYANERITAVVGIESRGFILGAPLALALRTGFIPIRKPGKLPHTTVREDYALEYGFDALEAHADALHPGDRVLIVDDVLATGGTGSAAVRLVERLGATVIATCFLLELRHLNGRQQLGAVPIHALLSV